MIQNLFQVEQKSDRLFFRHEQISSNFAKSVTLKSEGPEIIYLHFKVNFSFYIIWRHN